MHYELSIIGRLKRWTLPISMISGALLYVIGHALPLSPLVKAETLHGIEFIQPILLFIMLFLAFSKVEPRQMKPRRWHLWIALIQSTLFAATTFLLWLFPDTEARLALEGFMLAILCPTATACAVVTQKLGGDSAATTSYTIIINIIIAILAPLLLPIAHPQPGMTFIIAFLTIIYKVFPLLMVPLFLAWAVRYFLPSLHRLILHQRDAAFYMWAVALAFAITVTCKALAHSNESLWHVGAIAFSTLIACIFQFAVGKWIGRHYGYRMEAGQAMGQKNTIFIIWLGYTFLSPISATAGGFYSIWHNVINSYQLYQHQKATNSVKDF